MASIVHPVILIFVLFCSHLDQAEAVCPTGQISCRSGNQCIQLSEVCRSGNQCSDGSDEDPRICSFWTYDSSCSEGFYCSIYGCTSIQDFCNREPCYSQHKDSRICTIVKNGRLKLKSEESSMNLTSDRVPRIVRDFQLYTDSCSSCESFLVNVLRFFAKIVNPRRNRKPSLISTTAIPVENAEELVNLLHKAVNSTSSNYNFSCPMFYDLVGGICLSFFSPAKIPWPEARQFCLSIKGDLLQLNDLVTYGEILNYIRKSKLTTDYWIGGRYDLDTNAWSWVTDDSPMPLGPPYWATRYNSSCVARPPPHTDPFRSPAEALPGAPCFNYIQAPAVRSQGWCAAMTYEHYYYLTDEECQDSRSPICIYIE